MERPISESTDCQIPIRPLRATIEITADGEVRILPVAQSDAEVDLIIQALRREFSAWPFAE